jgi:hypothetical protein
LIREHQQREATERPRPRPSRERSGVAAPARHLLQLQQRAGNRAVSGVLQRKHLTTSYAGAYDANEVRAMLNASQGRAGSTGAAGHVREHVKDAAETREYARTEQKTKTCFVNDAQQNVAVTSALNSSYGQTQLARLDAEPGTNRVVISDVGIDAVNAWRSTWDAAAAAAAKSKRIRPAKATMIVDRLPTLTRPELHVQTSYPVPG